MSMPADVALIVPVRNDSGRLRALLEQIAAWPVRPAQIIVASAGCDPQLNDLCRTHGCRLLASPAHRGAQMDAAARAATASVLWFVHADASPPTDGLQAIADALAEGADGGCFRFTFQGEARWHKTLLAHLVALRVRCGGTPYGDQGIFVRRDAYVACGGFPHQPLFEEVRLVKRLRRRHGFRPLPQPIGISTRRWERDGWWARSLRNRWLALCYTLGMPAERLSRVYHGPMEASEGREE
jgi:rSAM/selenodomain-associated transferase 2